MIRLPKTISLCLWFIVDGTTAAPVDTGVVFVVALNTNIRDASLLVRHVVIVTSSVAEP